MTVLSPAAALAVNAMHLTAIMLRRAEDEDDLIGFHRERNPAAYVLGPGFGVGERTRSFTEFVLGQTGSEAAHLVLDADGITAFSSEPERLFKAAGKAGGALVLTPHSGEFGRLFPDLADDDTLSKLERARQAAARSGAVLVLKGADTVIAAPDGSAAINTNGTPYLATAGSGDVLAGMIAGLVGQGMEAFDAASAAVWLHAEAGRFFGAGLVAEDLPDLLPRILKEQLQER
ncbi:NAD(P)H-hydrate dehydratase [Chelativorans sp. Marseille-P2723]|uniref:ADP-dependent NAD(P)H-hydrate dehydratase n=1 Tax=Chelativorans sp. Marseille-P2723 TaxID=2709133 RepID=UPI0032B2FA78